MTLEHHEALVATALAELVQLVARLPSAEQMTAGEQLQLAATLQQTLALRSLELTLAVGIEHYAKRART